MNADRRPHTNKQTKRSNEQRLFTLEKSLTSKPSNDFEQSSMNITRTTFVSPSLNSFTMNNVQITEDSLLKTTQKTNRGSLLVRAYHNQENQKSILNESIPEN